MHSLFFTIWLIVGCNNDEPPPSMLPPVVYQGQLKNYNPSDCEFAVNIDVIQKGDTEPIFLTEVDNSGHFELILPEQSADEPLHVYGFCHNSTTDLDADVPIWGTEPFLLLPTHDPDKLIELTKATIPQDGDFVVGPLVITSRSTEYTLWSQNPLLIEYYDLRHPKRDSSTAGSLPEIRQGGVTTQTQLTHIFALLSLIRANSDPYVQDLLLPRSADLRKLNTDLLPTSPQIQITRDALENACIALKLPCPSLNNLRQQQWILNDKSSVSTPELTRHKARLWFTGHHFIQQLLIAQQDIPPTIPMPSDLMSIKTTEDARSISARWNELYETYNLTKVFINEPF